MPSVRISELDEPPRKVSRALTEPMLLARWLPRRNSAWPRRAPGAGDVAQIRAV